MFCQKCRTPLRLDSSLENLSPTAYNLLVEAAGKSIQHASSSSSSSRLLYTEEQKKRYDEAAENAGPPVFKRSVLPLSGGGAEPQASPAQPRTKDANENPAMSFVMLTESQIVPPAITASPNASNEHQTTSSRRRRRSGGYQDQGGEENSLSHKMEATARLFEILSSRSDIDHPICAECTDMLIQGMERKLANATRERDAYETFLKNANADAPTDEERQQAEEELAAVRGQESTALAELKQLEAEKAALEEQIASLDREARQLDDAEEQFWRERNAFAEVVSEFQSERESINLRYEHDSRELEKLSRTNVFNDTFCISHTKTGFATINNLRLGRTKDISVPWPEVNAAWGMSLLLLATVAKKLDFTFDGYVLHPMGSTSTIEKVDTSSQTSAASQSSKRTSTSLSLFYSSEMPLSIGFLHRHFDAAMIAFLECVRQLGDHVQLKTAGTSIDGDDEGLQLPCEIRKDKIGDATIRLPTFEAVDGWNTACKRVLTCCKFLLAATSRINGQIRAGK